MAENPGALIALIAFLKAGLVDGSVASLLDMLCCYTETGDFPGIRDLRPASTETAWLARLQAEEGLHPDARMELFAVGGEKQPTSFMECIAGFSVGRIIGSKPNDLVVARSSSLPLLSNAQSMHKAVNCDHFSYFKEDQASILEEVVTFLRRTEGQKSAKKSLTG